ncbi:hypothetical protein [Leptospira mtsangambouensis]|uniref:hypothetical protein n=1 Tax=Leptospira mtsangambouensis TaxID=2484912 RepID=UPI002F267D59
MVETLALVRKQEILNWGVLVGRCINLFIVDVDAYELTLAKFEKIAELSQEFRSKYEFFQKLMSSTFTSKSQRGGRHHYFLYNGIEKYKQAIKKGFNVEKHLASDSELISQYEALFPRQIKPNGTVGELLVDIDFLNGKQLVLLPHCVITDKVTGEPQKSYSIYTDKEVRELSDEEFSSLLEFFNGIVKKEDNPLKVRKIKVKKEKTVSLTKPKVSKVGKQSRQPRSQHIQVIRNSQRIGLNAQELESYYRELNAINHSKKLKGKPEIGFLINKHYECLGDKSLTEDQLKEKCGGRRTPRESSWIRKLYQLGISKKSIQHFAELHLNVNCHSYSDRNFIDSLYARIESGDTYDGIDSDMRNCIDLINKYNFNSLYGGCQTSCKRVLESLYTIAISNHSYSILYVSNGSIALNCRIVLAEKTVRESMKKIIESNLITVTHEGNEKKIIKYIRLLNSAELEARLNEACEYVDAEPIDTYSLDSRLPLHQIKGIGKRGEELYRIIRKLDGIHYGDIYSLLPNINPKNRIKEIKYKIEMLLAHGFLIKDEEEYIAVSDKSMLDCEKIIMEENKKFKRDRKLKGNPVESQIQKLLSDKENWKTNKMIFEIEKIRNKFVSGKVREDEKGKFKAKLLAYLSVFAKIDAPDTNFRLNFNESEPAYAIHECLEFLG